MGEPGAARLDDDRQPETEVPVLLMIDATMRLDETGFLPLPVVLENIKQALSHLDLVDLGMAHISVREHREQIMHAFDAANDEEQRRLDAEHPASIRPDDTKEPTDG